MLETTNPRRGKLVPIITINQIVANNLSRARRERGWSQEDLGERLGQHLGHPWSVASVSAAERSIDSGRGRRFDANELAAFARVFGLPISYFFLPPESGEMAMGRFSTSEPHDVVDGQPWQKSETMTREQLAEAIEPYLPSDTFVDRLRRLLAEFHIGWKPATRTRTTPIPDEVKDKTRELVMMYKQHNLQPDDIERVFRELPADPNEEGNA
jgi:transcriptional regulator with XRE-family HTH domain